MPSSNNNKHRFQISVKGLIEFSCRKGDLFFGFRQAPSAQEGIKGHKLIQKQRPDEYQKEVTVQHTVIQDKIELKIGGRIDGVFPNQDPIIIEEIKTTLYPMEALPESMQNLHLAQAKIYAFIYCLENEKNGCQIQMTYLNLKNKRETSHRSDFTFAELQSFFETTAEPYLQWLEKLVSHQIDRNDSIQKLSFPYGEFRPGQRDLAVEVYRSITNKRYLITQAPTGIGKTISTLFPSIKALGEEHHDTIFYLIAKTVGRTVVENAIKDMVDHGMILKSLTLTAKDKICFCKNGTLDFDTNLECPYTQGFYDRLSQGMLEFFEHSCFNRSTIEAIAQKHQLCPFELSLEFSTWADVIIGDYNYMFHPSASLKRLKGDRQRQMTLLVDEAHNLLDRARDMFTVSLSKQKVLNLKGQLSVGHDPAAFNLLKKSLNQVNRCFLNLKKECLDEASTTIQRKELSGVGQQLNVLCFVSKASPNFELALRGVGEAVELWMREDPPALMEKDVQDELIDFYFQAIQFLKILELYDDNYVTIIKLNTPSKGQAGGASQMEVTLYCLDPSSLLNEVYHEAHSVTFFSATLKPFDFYTRVLGLEENHLDELDPNSVLSSIPSVELSSPFPANNAGVFIANHIKTTYKERADYHNDIAELILQVIACQKGKYLVCFPSYQYMHAIKDLVCEQNPNTLIIEQTSHMDEESRNLFLDQFTNGRRSALEASETECSPAVLGFAIMGGLFGEGIDLPGDQLIGMIVVGVGLPQIGLERELIKEHFEHRQWPGYAFAYQYPGMNRVLQAAGRVIRSSTDRGIIVLVDERFNQYRYRQLFPQHWNYQIANGTPELKTQIDQFWAGPSAG